MDLSELHARVPAAATHDLLAPDPEGPQQESLFPDDPEPEVVEWDADQVQAPPPLTHAQAVALVEHVLGAPREDD